MKKKFNNIALPIFILVALMSCQKMDLTEDIEISSSSKKEEIRRVNSTQLNTTQYDVQDLLDLLGMYGTATPDITPAFNNYYQDITGGGSRLGQLSKVDGELFVTNIGELVNDTTNYLFEWYINDVLQCIEANPKLWDLDDNLICDGVVELKLVIKNIQRGSEFERTQWAYLDYNYIDNCDCLGCPNLFEVFYDFYPEVDAYYYMTVPDRWDFNANGLIDSSDLTTFLSYYGG